MDSLARIIHTGAGSVEDRPTWICRQKSAKLVDARLNAHLGLERECCCVSSISIRFPGVFAVLLVTVFVPRLAPGQQITVQPPTFGIAIDADGVLSHEGVSRPDGKAASPSASPMPRRGMPGDMRRWSDLRKVSLVKLERAIAAKLDAGEKPDDAMLHLAGLQRAQYVFFYPESATLSSPGRPKAGSKICRAARSA